MRNQQTQEAAARCLRCGRHLRSQASVGRGYGRWCMARIRAAAIAVAVRDFSSAQVDKARELISDGGLVPFRKGVWRAVSSSGDATYLTAASGQCNCPAGLRGRPCYHGLAARIMTAGKAA